MTESRSTGPEAIKRQMRLSAILSMRLQGHTLQQIGQSMDPPVSMQAIHKTLKKALRDMLVEPFEAIRTMELARLDELLVGVYPAALNGDVAAVDRVLSIMQRRSRLMGLDMRHVRDTGRYDPDSPPTVRVEIVNDPERARAEQAARLLVPAPSMN